MIVAALLVAGALGAVVRDIVDRAVRRWLPAARLPVGILVVNVLGSFLLGVVVTLRGGPGDAVAVVGGVGFLGAFTTFSTFAVDTVRLPARAAVAHVIANVGGCLLAVTVGIALAGMVRAA